MSSIPARWLPVLPFCLFCAMAPAQTSLELPKSPAKRGPARQGGGEPVLPGKPGKKKEQDKGGGKRGGDPTVVPEGLASLLGSLEAKGLVGTEELVAEYELLSGEDRKSLRVFARSLSGRGLTRLARVHSALKDRTFLPLFLSRLRSHDFGAETEALVEAVLVLSGNRAPNVAVELLASPRKGVRSAARKGLLRRLPRLDTEILIPLLHHRNKAARLAALEVLGEFLLRNPAAGLQALVLALGHKDGSLRLLAARYLLGLGEKAIPLLTPVVERVSSRKEFFLAALILGRLELLRDEPILTPGVVEALELQMEGGRPLPTSVGAFVTGVRHFMKPEGREEEGSLIEALLRVVDADSFYPELPVCHDSALLVLKLLSGRDYGNDKTRWRAWWDQNRKLFHPFRRDLPLDPQNLRKAVLSHVEGGEPKLLLLGPEAVEPDLPGREARFRLSGTAFASFLKDLRKAGFLDLALRMAEGGGLSEDEFLELRTGSGLLLDGFVSRGSLRLRKIRRLLQRLLDREIWQTFASSSLGPAERLAWWRKHATELARTEEGEDRDRYLLDLCCSSIEGLSSGCREKAMAFLFGLIDRRRGIFESGHADLLLSEVSKGRFPPEQAGSLMEIVALIPGERPFRKLLDVIGESGEYDARTLLPKLLALAGSERILLALRAGKARIRALAAEQAWKLKNPAAYPILVSLLKDPEDSVKIAAARSCGRLCLREAFESVKELCRSGNPNVRSAALLALAGVGGKEAFDILERATAQGGDGERLAAVMGLSLLEDPRAKKVLLRVGIARYPDPLAQQALAGLRDKGGPLLRGEILRRIERGVTPGLKRELVFLLGLMQDPRVFGALLAELKAGRSTERACRILAAISGRDFCRMAGRVSKYEEWGRKNFSKGQASWLLDALKEEGFSTILKTPSEVEGGNPVHLEELCRILEGSKRWPTRALAAHFLRDLTMQDFGTVEEGTSPGSLQAKAERYRSYFRAKRAIGGK